MAQVPNEAPRKAADMPMEDMRPMSPEQHMNQPTSTAEGMPRHKGAPSNMPRRT